MLQTVSEIHKMSKDMKKGTIYPESAKLKAIINSHGWTLYDTTFQGKRKEFVELEREGPARNFTIGHNYMFVPHQIPGKSLRETYAITKGLGPSLIIQDYNEGRWRTLYLTTGRYQHGKPILFTRLDFQPKFLGAFTPVSSYLPNPDMVGIDYRFAIQTFEKYFRIITQEEEGTVIIPTVVPRVEDAN